MHINSQLGLEHLLHDFFIFQFLSINAILKNIYAYMYRNSSNDRTSQREYKVTLAWVHVLFISDSISLADYEIVFIYIT